MHELSVCRSLIGEVARVAARHNSTTVTAIAIAVGPLSGVAAPLLARAFEIARMGTVAEAAMLEIETTPVVVHCPACGTESDVAPNALLCSGCGSWKVTLKSGDELLLKRVELSREDETATA